MGLPQGWRKIEAFRGSCIRGLPGRARGARWDTWGVQGETVMGEKGGAVGDTTR